MMNLKLKSLGQKSEQSNLFRYYNDPDLKKLFEIENWYTTDQKKMIKEVNWKDEYTIINEHNEEKTVKADKMGRLENAYIKNLLTSNLGLLFMGKLTGIDETKLNEIPKNVLVNLNEFLNDAKREKIVIFMFLLIAGSFKFEVRESENEQDSKKFIATIEKVIWDQSSAEIILDYCKKNLDSFNEINIDSNKTMYDLIKEETTTIEIDLTNN